MEEHNIIGNYVQMNMALTHRKLFLLVNNIAHVTCVIQVFKTLHIDAQIQREKIFIEDLDLLIS